jgi:CheY-like chemotaxis protein
VAHRGRVESSSFLLRLLLREGIRVEKRILLVEDDASFREVFTRALGMALASEHLDVSFVEAGTLAAARVRLKEGGLDAALIDVTIPDGDGLELVGEINNGGGLGSPIPTMVLTVSLETSVAGRAIEQGARGALSKVASMPETVDAIKRLTDAYRSSA